MSTPETPTAATITIRETLDLLDGDAGGVAGGVADGKFALWLGSGISMNSVPGLAGAIRNVLEFLHARADTADEKCEHHLALREAIKLADLDATDLREVDLTKPVSDWAHLDRIIRKLVRRYSELLDIRVADEDEDYLLWEGVDIKSTYAAAVEPGTEHLCVAILALEGVIHDIPSANWDGLIETAIEQLAKYPSQALEVLVLKTDFQGASNSPRLLKFHGCAVLAARDEARYRSALVGTSSQITDWTEHGESDVMCKALTLLATEKRTLMIGLSAQDVDIQNVFTKAKNLMPWSWSAAAPAYAFAEQEIGDMQKNLLKVVYRDEYQKHLRDIDQTALIRAYAEPLLAALVLHILAAKLSEYVMLAPASGISAADRQVLTDGIRHIRDEVAESCEPNRLGSVRAIIQAQSRALELFRTGGAPTAGDTTYSALSRGTVESIRTDPGIESGGMRELATALGVLGHGESEATWTLRVQGGATGKPGAFTVSSGTGDDVAVHFAVNNGSAVRQEALATVAAAPDKTIMVHSVRPVQKAARNPRTSYGRTGHAGIRHVDMESLLETCTSVAQLQEQFRTAASI